VSTATPPRRRRLTGPIVVLVGGFALFTWLSGGPPPPEPTLPPASAAPTPRSAAETEQATALLSQIIRAAGLGVVMGGPDVRPPLPPEFTSLPRVVVRGASSLDPSGMPLIAVLFPSIGDAGAASERIGDYLAAPNTLVLVPPDARFTVQRSGSWIIFFQRTPSGDPDPAAADLLETTLTSYGEAVTIPR